MQVSYTVRNWVSCTVLCLLFSWCLQCGRLLHFPLLVLLGTYPIYLHCKFESFLYTCFPLTIGELEAWWKWKRCVNFTSDWADKCTCSLRGGGWLGASAHWEQIATSFPRPVYILLTRCSRILRGNEKSEKVERKMEKKRIKFKFYKGRRNKFP